MQKSTNQKRSLEKMKDMKTLLAKQVSIVQTQELLQKNVLSLTYNFEFETDEAVEEFYLMRMTLED